MNTIRFTGNTGYYIFLFLSCFLIPDQAAVAQRGASMYAPRVRSASVTVEAGIAILGCDLTSLDNNYYVEPLGGIELGYNPSQNLRVALFASRGGLTAKNGEDIAKCTFNSVGASGQYYFRMYRGKFNPYVVARIGGVFGEAESTQRGIRSRESVGGAVFGGGAGFEFHPRSSLGIRIQAMGYITTTDHLDALDTGRMQDGYSTFSAGITYYFTLRR